MTTQLKTTQKTQKQQELQTLTHFQQTWYTQIVVVLEIRPALDKAHEKRLPEDRIRTIFFTPRAWQTCANKRRLASRGRITKLLALASYFRMRCLFAEKRELDTPKINIYTF